MINDQALRDTFAAAAISGLLADMRYTLGPHEAAQHAYAYADAMLRERLRNGAAAACEQANTNSADFSNTLRNGAPSARETVPQAATTVGAAVVDTAPSPNSVAAQPPTCDGARQSFDSTSTDHDAAPAARAVADRERPDNPPPRPGDGTGDTPTLTDAERDDLEMWLAECLKQGVRAEMACEVERADRWAARAARAAALLARLGGGK